VTIVSNLYSSVIALSKLYSLNDSRIGATNVKGDQIIRADDRIMTRSRARESELMGSPQVPSPSANYLPDPEQYTIVPAPLKMLKVLIEELLSASGIHAAANAASAAVTSEFADLEEDDGDEGWEDDHGDTLDLALGSTKAELMGFLDSRQRDDETQQYLVEFFKSAAQNNTASFGQWFEMLTEDEKVKLRELTQ